MLAFAGCSNKIEEGTISGSYEEKTPEQIEEIIDNIDGDKVFSEDIKGLGLKASLSGSYSMGEIMSGNLSADLSFMLATGDEGEVTGSGTASLKSEMSKDGQTSSSNFSANGYLEDWYFYGEAKGNTSVTSESGKTDTDIDRKAKVNLLDILSIVGDIDYSENDLSVSDLLSKAPEFGVTVAVDDRDGVKFKLSATQDTVWALLSAFGEDMTEESLESIKQAVTFNAFKFDLYFALDKDGEFSRASAVIDIDVTVNSSLLEGMFDDDEQLTDFTATVKGSVEIYVHEDAVKVPEGLATDEDYYDCTEMLAEIIKDYI